MVIVENCASDAHQEDVDETASSNSSHGDCHDKNCGHEHHHGDDESSGAAKISKGEKKARKIIEKLGLKPMTGIKRVTVKKSKTMIFVVAGAQVYKSSDSGSYVILGQPRFDDLAQNLQAAAAKQFTAPKTGEPVGMEKIDEEDEEAMDESKFDPKDIELVMEQTGCTRSRAVGALHKTNGDFVEAILELSG